MGNSSLSGYTIYLRLLAMKGFNAIRPEYNCFISMIISVDTLCGFAPLLFTVPICPPSGQGPYYSLGVLCDGDGPGVDQDQRDPDNGEVKGGPGPNSHTPSGNCCSHHV